MKKTIKTLTLFLLLFGSFNVFASNGFEDYNLALLDDGKFVPFAQVALATEKKPEIKKTEQKPAEISKEEKKLEEDTQKKFEEWKNVFTKKALTQGITKETIDKVFARIYYSPKIISHDKNQPEVKFTFDKYKSRMINDYRINQGLIYYNKNRELIDKIAGEYRVQARFIVALWGLETSYGYNIGNHFVPKVLATLAFEGRRRNYFESELITALKIIQNGMIDIEQFNGSWAGAFGQSQFMPNTYFAYAKDYNKDGKVDLYNTPEDIFASIANYLRFLGWDNESTWGRKVRLPDNFDLKANNKQIKAITEWRAMGVLKDDGKKLPRTIQAARMIIFDEDKNNAFITYDNFKLTKRWNNSDSFATVVGLLSDAIENKDKEEQKQKKEQAKLEAEKKKAEAKIASEKAKEGSKKPTEPTKNSK
jgi:membrane-bound lytic murein transglycosylase B